MTSVNCRQTYIELGIWCIYPLAYKLYYMHGIGSYKVRLLTRSFNAIQHTTILNSRMNFVAPSPAAFWRCNTSLCGVALDMMVVLKALLHSLLCTDSYAHSICVVPVNTCTICVSFLQSFLMIFPLLTRFK